MGCQAMSLIKASISGQPEQDQPKPALTEAQWNHLLSTLHNAIYDPHPQLARESLAHLRSWLLHIKNDSGTYP